MPIGKTINIKQDITHDDYLIVNGVRFNRESKMEESRRTDYEEGGRFHHLVGDPNH